MKTMIKNKYKNCGNNYEIWYKIRLKRMKKFVGLDQTFRQQNYCQIVF